MMKHKITIFMALAFLIIAAVGTSAKADGIDCSKAIDAVDKLICVSDELKAQDKIMAGLYAVARVSIFGSGQSGEIAEQQTWLTSRTDCLKPPSGTPTECLVDLYQTRNLDLAYAAMPKAADLALQVLKDQKVEAEPVFEALSIYAAEPDGTNWERPELASKRDRIVALATPLITAIDNAGKPEATTFTFQHDLLDEGSVKSPGDILKSSQHFGSFLKAALYGAQQQATLPCGYVSTHPGLLVASESYFGSTMDTNLVNTNCTKTTPPTPKLNALLAQIHDGWPQCEGTIRFGAYRSFDVAVDEALAPSAKQVQNHPPAKPLNSSEDLSGVTKSALRSATGELAAYYVKYLKATPSNAAQFAKAKIAKLQELGQQCE